MYYEKELYEYAADKLKSFNDVKIIGHSKNKGAILSFTIDNIHPNDIGLVLDQHNVAVRTGHHCAQPLMDFYKVPAMARASIAFYNSHVEMELLASSIEKVRRVFN